MNTTVLFNIDKKLKTAAMRKARSQGMTLTAVLNIATQAYVNESLQISAFERDIAQARREVREGKSFTQEAIFNEIGIT
jgi:antitoxin component of RelBE/YafQ-DinJ toxin-antitoxin module